MTNIRISRRLFLNCCTRMAALCLLGRRGLATAETAPSAPYLETLLRLFGAQSLTASTEILIELPETVEDGAAAPLGVESRLNPTARLYLLADQNPIPLLADIRFAAGIAAKLRCRVKLAADCHVVAVAESGGQYFIARKWVNVRQGGCG